MRDFARSDNPQVQAQLDRLARLSVPDGRLGLETITALLERLDDPHKRLPPVFHVAGTNGKGSVCAFLRAMLEADGKRVHMTTSPHLVRYNERIRLAGELISDKALAELLEEVLDVGDDLNPSFFEVTIAAAFLAFSREPADACIVEVGLGGRFDATNVLGPEVLAACGIAALGIDHERFLLAPEDGVPEEPLARIAFEKAGIAKAVIPLVTLDYPLEARAEIERAAARVGVPWQIASPAQSGYLSIAGTHQRQNAGLAMAMLRSQSRVQVSEDSIAKGLTTTKWPARMQQLQPGPLVESIGTPVILDGAHNANAAQALADAIGDGPIVMLAGVLKNREPAALFEQFKDRVSRFTGLPVPGHDAHDPKVLCRVANEAFSLDGSYPAGSIAQAFDQLRQSPPAPGERVLVMGSLYLAGEMLRLNDEVPD